MGAEGIDVRVVCPQVHDGYTCDLCCDIDTVAARLVDPEAVLQTLLLARLREIAARPDADGIKHAICDAFDGWYLLREDRDNAGLIVSLLAPASPEEGTDGK